MSHSVVENRVSAGGDIDEAEERHAHQAPADGVSGLANGDRETDKDRHESDTGYKRCGGGKLVSASGE